MNFVFMLRERLAEVKTRPQFGASSRKKGDARFPYGWIHLHPLSYQGSSTNS